MELLISVLEREIHSRYKPMKTPVTSSRKFSVFVVDDHPLVREWLRSIIEMESDLSVCGEAGAELGAFEAIERLHPDIAIVDLSLAGSSGLDLIRSLQALPSPPKVLVLSMFDELSHGAKAIHAGGSGYVSKRATTAQILHAVRQVLSGKLYFSPELSGQITERHFTPSAVARQPLEAALSNREMEVFKQLGQGKGTRHIAENLNISIKTVQVYCSRIKGKLGLENARALALESIRWVENGARAG